MKHNSVIDITNTRLAQQAIDPIDILLSEIVTPSIESCAIKNVVQPK